MSQRVHGAGLVTLPATMDTDLSAKDFFFVNLDPTDDENVNLAAGATLPLFILEEGKDGSTDKALGTIILAGTVYGKLGGTVQSGDRLTSDGNGKLIKTTTSGNHYGAIALDGGVINDEVLVWATQGEVV